MGIADAKPIEPDALKGLAHPLRIRLLDVLSFQGPATASMLGRTIGESSGATSYHLRQLARFGFVEEAPPEGAKGRERWWRAAEGGFTLAGAELRRSPATRAAATLVIQEINRGRATRLQRWLDSVFEPTSPWHQVGADASYELRLTPEQLRALIFAIDAVISEHKTRAEADPRSAADAAPVEVQLNAFPVLP